MNDLSVPGRIALGSVERWSVALGGGGARRALTRDYERLVKGACIGVGVVAELLPFRVLIIVVLCWS
jgi:hypothetical protein